MTQRCSSTPGWRLHRRQAAGFTLIELMTVVVIATVLLTVAVPVYKNQIQKSRRTDAKSALLDLASREERYYSVNNVYTNDASSLGYSTTSQTLVQFKVGSGYYQANVCVGTGIPATCNAAQALGTGPSYLLAAVPITTGPQANDTCGTYTLDNTGVENNTGTTTSGCW